MTDIEEDVQPEGNGETNIDLPGSTDLGPSASQQGKSFLFPRHPFMR